MNGYTDIDTLNSYVHYGNMADVSGGWLHGYIPGLATNGTLTTGAWAKDNIQVSPFVVPRGRRISAVTCNVTVGAGGVNRYCRHGIYRPKSATDLYPGVLVVDFGDAATSGTGPQSFSTNLPFFLPAGLYFSAWNHGHSGTNPTMSTVPYTAQYTCWGIQNFVCWSFRVIVFFVV